MTDVSPPQRHHSRLFHRHRSNSYESTRSPSPPEVQCPVNVPIFQGTDAVSQNQKVALSRVLDVHQALELQQQQRTLTSSTSASSSNRPTSSSSSTSNDSFVLDFTNIPFPDAETRAFKYFLRLWDPTNTAPDPDFEAAIQPQRRQFEETAIRHFFQRISLWEENNEVRESMSRSFFRRRRSRARSVAGKLGMMKKDGEGEGEVSDGLKEVTTREGLAQLLWTLVHDAEKPLGDKLEKEFDEALKVKYGMTETGTAIAPAP